jgi:hypothetical protein
VLDLVRELGGARVAAMVPLPDHLLNRLIAQHLPAGGRVDEVRVRARDGNRFDVWIRLSRPSIVPPFTVTMRVERQPRLPGDPRLLLRPESGALGWLVGPALRFAPALPPGISTDGGQVAIDIARLMEQRGLGELFEYLRELQIGTVPGAFVVNARAEVPNR